MTVVLAGRFSDSKISCLLFSVAVAVAVSTIILQLSGMYDLSSPKYPYHLRKGAVFRREKPLQETLYMNVLCSSLLIYIKYKDICNENK